jgi:surface antigen
MSRSNRRRIEPGPGIVLESTTQAIFRFFNSASRIAKEVCMARNAKVIATLALGAGLIVCGATQSRAQDSTLLGAGAGAGGGAGIGFALGGPVGAVVGGLVGAGVGAGSGHIIGKKDGPSSTAAPAASGADLTAAVQGELNASGYDAGPADGRYGPRTGNAIRAYQYNNGLAQDGRPSVALLDHLRAKRAGAQPTGAPAQPAAYAPAAPAYQPAPAAPAAAGTSTAPALPALPGAQRQATGAGAGANCKPYESRTTIDGKETVKTGTACLQADGTWKPVN